MKIFQCEQCENHFEFTSDIRDYNYICCLGFICDTCFFEREQDQINRNERSKAADYYINTDI